MLIQYSLEITYPLKNGTLQFVKEKKVNENIHEFYQFII